MKYIVSVKIDGRIDVEVDTDSFEEAKWLAEMEAGDCDWNRIETDEIVAVNAKDETGESIDYKKDHLEVRIRYVENWNDQGECFIFENKWTNEDEWGLDTAFKLVDYNEKKGEVISYQALTKIRELMKLGIPFRFGN